MLRARGRSLSCGLVSKAYANRAFSVSAFSAGIELWYNAHCASTKFSKASENRDRVLEAPVSYLGDGYLLGVHTTEKKGCKDTDAGLLTLTEATGLETFLLLP